MPNCLWARLCLADGPLPPILALRPLRACLSDLCLALENFLQHTMLHCKLKHATLRDAEHWKKKRRISQTHTQLDIHMHK